MNVSSILRYSTKKSTVRNLKNWHKRFKARSQCENQWARLWFEGGLAVRAVILEAVWVFSLESTIYLVTIFFVYWNIQNLLMGIVQILF